MNRNASLLFALYCFIALLLPFSAKAQSNLPIYTGTTNALASPWQNWSWCTTNFGSTAYVHSGDTYSAQITYTAGWQGFYVENPGINTVLYSNLTFWINGGSAGGQQIAVYGLINNVAGTPVSLNSYITGGSVAANQWRQVTIPLKALGVANTANVDGFWLMESTGSAQPSFYIDNMVLTAAPIPSPINIAVNAGKAVRTVDSRVFGINTAIWDSDLNTTNTTSLLSAANTQILRFPGGSASDSYHWQTNTSVGSTFQWASNFDAFAAVATGIKAQAFITVNYGSGTAQEAANWVTYSNKTKGYGFKYWEIGNEVYGSWEYDTHAIPNDPYTYAQQVQAYITAMKAVDPTIKIGVVGITGEDSYANNTNHPATNPRTGVVHNGWTPVMLTTLKSLGVTPDFLIYHRYEQNPGSESDESLLQAASTWPNDAANLRQQLSDYLGAAGANVELVCTENNSVSYNPGKQTTSLVNGLYLADSLGNLLQTEFNALAWWDLRNGQETGNNNDSSLYGWREYGDYGVLDSNTGYPTYYAMKLLSHLGAGGDTVVSAASNYPLLSSYSVLRQDGSLSILVINKSATNALTGVIALSNFIPSGTATIYSYGMPQDNAAQTGVGSTDVALTTLSKVSANFSYSFPAYSLTILAIPPLGAPTFTSSASSSSAPKVGKSMTLTALVTNTSGLLPNGIVDLELYNASGTQVAQWYFTGQSFTKGKKSTYSASWTPSTKGTYTLKIGVFGANWSPIYSWNNAAVTFTVD